MAKTTEPQTTPVSKFAPDETMTLKLDWEKEISSLYQKKLAAAAKNLKIDGFRQGKVPLAIAATKIDQEKLAQNVLQDILPARYQAQLKTDKIEPVGQPEFVIMQAEPNQDWEIEVHYALKPVIKLGDYQKTLATAKKKARQEIEAEEKKKAAAAKEQAAKVKAAATKKEAGEKADVVEMDPTQTPLTQEQINSQVLDRAIVALRDQVEVKVAEVLVKRQAQARLEEILQQLRQYQIELDDYLKNTGQEFGAFADQITQEAHQQLQLDFILADIMADQKITATDDEIKAEFEKLFANQHEGHDHATHPHTPEEEAQEAKLIEERQKDPAYRNYVTDLIKRQKLLEFLQKA